MDREDEDQPTLPFPQAAVLTLIGGILLLVLLAAVAQHFLSTAVP
jgi:hypothetical protein